MKIYIGVSRIEIFFPLCRSPLIIGNFKQTFVNDGDWIVPEAALHKNMGLRQDSDPMDNCK